MKRISTWDKFGFTTGMAAAAAAAAACDLIVDGRKPSTVPVTTPDGRHEFLIEISAVAATGAGAAATVIKRAGPDRDITDGMAIEVDVTPDPVGRVIVDGGRGIGRVTRPGLSAQVGEAAINPAPLAHIQKVVMSKIGGGARVTVGAPEGAAVALKTFNARLGVIGGISILGTSGVVRPMSLASWKMALLPQLDQAAALGHTTVALTPGNLGAAAASALGLPRTAIVQMGNFAGFMMKAAAGRDLNFLLIGHLGKVVKIACGYENTHHQKTPDRLRLLAELVSEVNPGPPAAGLERLGTAEEIAAYLRDSAPEVIRRIAEKAYLSANKIAPDRCIGAMITNLSGLVVGAYPSIGLPPGTEI